METISASFLQVIVESSRFCYHGHKQLQRHVKLFLDADNQARRFKTLKDLTPAQFIWKEWQAKLNLPCHLVAGPNSLRQAKYEVAASADEILHSPGAHCHPRAPWRAPHDLYGRLQAGAVPVNGGDPDVK
jgi:hypothetical protein